MGIIRRIFRFIGSIISGIRTLLGVVIFGFVLIAIAGMFADDRSLLAPMVSVLRKSENRHELI